VTEPEAEAEEKLENKEETEEDPPKKTPRIRREHVYEEIGQAGAQELAEQPILELESLKKSLTRQDNLALDEIEAAKSVPLDRMGSSEEEQVTAFCFQRWFFYLLVFKTRLDVEHVRLKRRP